MPLLTRPYCVVDCGEIELRPSSEAHHSLHGPGSGWAMAELMTKGGAPLAQAFSLDRFNEGRFIDESVAAGVAH